MGKAAAQPEVLEQPEEVSTATTPDVASDAGDSDAGDLAEAADAIEGENG
jgi:hypothetical protein